MQTDFPSRPTPPALRARALPGRLRRAVRQLADEIGHTVTAIDPASGALILAEAGLLLGARSTFDNTVVAAIETLARRTGFDAVLLTDGGATARFAFYRASEEFWRRPYARWRECPGLVFAPADRTRGHLVHVAPRGLIVTPLAANDAAHGLPLTLEVAA